MLAALSDSIPAVTIDALLEHIVVIDQGGTILSANKAWRDFALANGGDPLCVSEGINYLDVCDRAAMSGCGDAAHVASLVRDTLAGRRRCATFDYPCDAPHEPRWFSLKMTALDHAGAPAVVLVHDNITELKSCERQIQFQASLLASVEQAVIATDVAGTILYWNPFAEKLYGWSAAEAMGRNIIDLVPADSSAERAAQIMARPCAGAAASIRNSRSA
ncbi:PAS domain S-box protein [Massilia sp. CCM 8733]|uniref:PAS domain S-box protein n=1 Tax=Massilia mucilaginosa TaxID=2609282 RepID=A0ABX0NVZ1_9BURK|nr:PAS domain S-box protein [Massilia mucilaginosa]NHZ90904.1 PAS domain S-box protein [Massilia mucilaginosa]